MATTLFSGAYHTISQTSNNTYSLNASLSYDSRRSGANMQYRFYYTQWINWSANGKYSAYFNYTIYTDLTVNGSTTRLAQFQDGSYGWSKSFDSGWITVSNKTSGTVPWSLHTWDSTHSNKTWSGSLPVISVGSPSISGSVSKTAASRAGSDGKASITLTRTAGSNASVSSYSCTCNGSTKSNTSPAEFTGLKNNTTYSWSASITNNAGLTGSTSGSFYLTPVAPAAPTVGTITYSRSSNTYTASLPLSTTYDTKRKFSKWNISYGTSTSYGSSGTSTSSSVGTISELEPNKTYYYSITATDANDSGAYSTALTSSAKTGSFTTPCNKPSGLTVSYGSSTETAISVTVSATGDTNAPITGYVLYYRKGTSGDYTSVDLGTSTSTTINGLDIDTNYEFYVSATNVAGTTDSTTYIYSTQLSKPSLYDIYVSDLHPFGFTVTAAVSMTPSRTLTYRFSKDGQETYSDWQSSNVYTFNDCTEETEYFVVIQVKAAKEGNNAQDMYARNAIDVITPADQAKIRLKRDGSWVQGKAYYKKDGKWVKVKKIYRKIDGQWKIGRND